jgi:hypothetical protein
MQINDMSLNEWRITIGIQRHWVTTEEKDAYLTSISKGMELVPLRNGTLVLGKNAQEIIHCSAIEESRQIEENRKEGKYQCDHGHWHALGTTCMHNVEMIEVDDKTIRLEERKPGQLPAPKEEQKAIPPARDRRDTFSYDHGAHIKTF